MPPVIIGAKIALGFVLGKGLGAFVARALLSTLFSMGVNAIFGRKPSTPQFDQGINTKLRVDATAPRRVIYGRARTGGTLVFVDETGTDNDKLWMVIALADHECDGLDAVYVNGQAVSWNSSTGVASQYTLASVDHLKVHWITGAESQGAYSGLVAASGQWTSAHRGRGISYIVVEALWEADLFKQIPAVEVVVRGKALYDRRLDSSRGGSGSHDPATKSTWEWDNGGVDIGENPALQVDDYLRGIHTNGTRIGGVGIDVDDLTSSHVITAANVCEESVTTITPASTEKRYRCGVVLDLGNSHKANLKVLLATMAGELHDHGGQLRLFAGEARTPVLTITDSDIVREIRNGQQRIKKKWKWAPDAGREERVNTVRGRFIDETNKYLPAEYPTRTTASYVTADGGEELAANLDFLGCPSHSQAQRLAEIFLRSSRQFGKLTSAFQPALVELESGDWVNATSVRQNWTGGTAKVFVVNSLTDNPDTTVDLVLQQMASTVFDWTPGTDEIAPKASVAATVPAVGASWPAKIKALASLDQVANDEIAAAAGIEYSKLEYPEQSMDANVDTPIATSFGATYAEILRVDFANVDVNHLINLAGTALRFRSSGSGATTAEATINWKIIACPTSGTETGSTTLASGALFSKDTGGGTVFHPTDDGLTGGTPTPGGPLSNWQFIRDLATGTVDQIFNVLVNTFSYPITNLYISVWMKVDSGATGYIDTSAAGQCLLKMGGIGELENP